MLAVWVLWGPSLCTALYQEEHCCTSRLCSEHIWDIVQPPQGTQRYFLLSLGFRTLLFSEVLSSLDD